MKPPKEKLPYMPFYVGDWKKCPEVQALPFDIRMMWFEMLCIMWESEERGVLTINKLPIDEPTLARMLSVPLERLREGLGIMENKNVFSRRENDGAIYSRRMVRDEKRREFYVKTGKRGGNPKLTGG